MKKSNSITSRAQYSTITQFINVIDDTTNSSSRWYKTAVTLLDAKKTFDNVWHD